MEFVAPPADFYPRPPRGGRHKAYLRYCWMEIISIHALREEGDPMLRPKPPRTRHFYPRPPRGGRHSVSHPVQVAMNISIHALREEGDRQHGGRWPSGRDFYPRPPRGGRLAGSGVLVHLIQFLSTPSARRATNYLAGPIGDFLISIHALREEGDFSGVRTRRSEVYFYPRPPRGGRPLALRSPAPARTFLSTPSARRATLLAPGYLSTSSNFYPRPPRGGRRAYR